jgi:Glutamine amidotransferase domain
LLHLYEKKGFALGDDLNGMFSFVIHDHKRNVLFGARDRMGIKPLYYWQSNGHFAFASELKCLLTLSFIEREIDQQSPFHYMTLLYTLPPDLLGSPKRGFVIPIELWLRRELRPLVSRLLRSQPKIGTR